MPNSGHRYGSRQEVISEGISAGAPKYLICEQPRPGSKEIQLRTVRSSHDDRKLDVYHEEMTMSNIIHGI